MNSSRPARLRTINRRAVITALAGSPAGASLVSKPVSAAPYRPNALNPKQKVTVGLLNSSSDAGLLLAADRGYFTDEGLDVELVPFKSLSDMFPLLGRGQLDVGAGGVAAGLFNAAARGVPLKIVADKGHMPGPRGKGDEYSTLMVRKDLIKSGKIRGYADLKGTKIALVGGPGSIGEFAVAKALANANLTLKDVTTISMAYPDLVPAFANGGVDAAILIEPFQTFIESQGTGVIWKTYGDLFGHANQIAVIVYSDSFVAKKDAARHFMIGYLRGVRDYNDAFGPKRTNYGDVVNVIARDTHQKPQIIDEVRPPGIDPDGRLEMPSLQEQLEYFTRAGEVTGKVDLPAVTDRSFADFAVSQLGRYRR
jgi:NitT/TauT family transport system substrate-binding protein